jgi:MFS transporter, PAT family, beta-lactamase induction signal transducer AmpG
MPHRTGSRNLLDSRNGRFVTFGLLYVSEGIPYGFTSVAMVAFMRQQEVSLALIGTFVAALFLPWAFKWAWAPAIDLIKLHRFGGRKAWIAFCTTMMVATLLIAASVDFKAHFTLLLAMIVLNNVFCATQDVAIDSLAVSTLQPDERGRANGFMFAGQYLGIALGGGGAMFVNGAFGFEAALAGVAGLLLLNLLFVMLYVRDPHVDPAPQRRPDALRVLAETMVSFVKEVYCSFWRSGRGPRLGVAFALLPIGALALAYATLGTIQVDYGLKDHQIAALSVYNTVAAAIGCAVGGWLGDRFGLKRTVATAYALTAAPALILAQQISAGGLQSVPIDVFYGLIIAHGLFFGMAYGVRNAIFMGMTNPAVAATQFTAFMGMSNLAISMGNYWQGIVAESVGYAVVLYLDALFALLVILLIPFLSERQDRTVAKAPGTAVAEDAVA